MKSTLWFALGLFLSTGPVFGAGFIVIHDHDFWLPPHRLPRPIHPPPAVCEPAEVTRVRVQVKLKDQVATTRVDQEIYNPNSRALEGTFLFPVPAGAHLDKFSMEVNGQPTEAELLKAEKAREVYEEIVRKLKDPGLLEFAGRDLFKVRIFPLEPHSTKKIKLAYTHLVKSDSGLASYVFPLNTQKLKSKPVRNTSIEVDLECRRSLKSIYSPSHKVDVKRDGPKRATVSYEAAGAPQEGDFQLLYSMAEQEIGLDLLTHKEAGEGGYFLLLATPGMEVDASRILPKDVTFVLDTSGSMAGPKLEQAKKALLFCVENLQDQDRFQILRFATDVVSVFDELMPASRENRAQARRFVEELKPLGGTAIDAALQRAVELRSVTGERPYVVVFLTDGQPTVGTTDEREILANLKKRNEANTRVFCFGIGTDVNTHLLDKVTEHTKAFSTYVLPEEDLEIKVSNFFTKIKEPVLANPRLEFPSGLRVSQVYPAPLPDLFRGEQLVVVGRYTGSASGDIRLVGKVGSDKRLYKFPIKLTDGDHDFLPRLWATRRVGYLLDEIRLRGENSELKEEVTTLARRYGIVTPYTAYLIVEDEKRRGVALHNQSLRRLREDQVALAENERLYSRMRAEKAGDAAVAGAQSVQEFKQANAPAAALSAGTAYAMRPSRGAADAPGPAQQAAQQQARFVGGRAFYQNGSQWIDADVQNRAQARRVRVQFESDEYFALAKSEPRAQPWLALGRNVQFVLGDTVYEIYE